MAKPIQLRTSLADGSEYSVIKIQSKDCRPKKDINDNEDTQIKLEKAIQLEQKTKNGSKLYKALAIKKIHPVAFLYTYIKDFDFHFKIGLTRHDSLS